MKCQGCEFQDKCIYEQSGVCLAKEDCKQEQVIRKKQCKVYLENERSRIFVNNIPGVDYGDN